MKSKYIPLICVLFLSLVLILSGCGKKPTAGPGADIPPESGASEPADNTPSGSETTDPTEDAPTGNGADEPTVEEKALAVYRDILKAAPAIEGEHEELADAGFGYEQNMELFGTHYDFFAITDIDKDGVPELLASSTINFRWAPISVFTYADGETVLLKDPLDESSHGTFEQKSTANGAYITYICEEDHIHSVWRGTDPTGKTVEENSAYILEGTTLTPVECTAGENENAICFSDIAKANTAENADAIIQ